MSTVIVTGSAGLVGSEAVRHFAAQGMDVIGIDNDMRAVFFGEEASTAWNRDRLLQQIPRYAHLNLDIRNKDQVFNTFRERKGSISLVVHCAAQPSHDWAASDPFMDLSVNANGTSVLLEATRLYAPDSVFIFMSTNKVYGDAPNRLPLVELETRYEIAQTHPYFQHGIPESMSIDQCLHSLFGASKVAADVLVQEYGRYFGMKTVCFRGGCLTGPNHSGTALHGFLAYLMKCASAGTHYNIFGYKGKQVRDNIHSHDLINAFDQFFRAPRSGEVYNMGGGRFSNCSMLEAIGMCEEITGKELDWTYVEQPRTGDHQWWVSDCTRFAAHYPGWQYKYDVRRILEEIHDALQERRHTAFSDSPAAPKPVAPVLAEKRSVLGILVNPVNYETAVDHVIDAARNRRGAAISALAVHGVMTGVNDPEHKYRLNSFDLVVPDGQPVRWMLNLKHRAGLNDRVYGPNLTLKVCERAAAEKLPVFFYGSTPSVLEKMRTNLQARYPELIFAGSQPSKFRNLTLAEKSELVETIAASGARIVFVGLGCPRQEIFAYEFREALSLPLLAVGAAFPFIAGELEQAPARMQDLGLEWLFRLTREPRRLWKRYLLLNPAYIAMAGLQYAGVREFSTRGRRPQEDVLLG